MLFIVGVVIVLGCVGGGYGLAGGHFDVLWQPFEFLIMDEPFSHLDSKNIRSCCALIQEECASQGAGFALLSLEERYTLDYDHTLVL